MLEVDPEFQKSQARARKRRQQRKLQQFAILGGGSLALFVILGSIGWLIFGPSDPDVATLDGEVVTASEEDFEPVEGQFVQVETGDAEVAPVRAATPFVDIAGDPLILRFESAEQSGTRQIAGPPTLDAARFGSPRSDRLALLVEPLIVQERQLITALPSSREDFAYFQAQRSAANTGPSLADLVARPDEGALAGDDEEEIVLVAADSDDSWGSAIGSDAGAEPAAYVETKIENTTSISFVRPEAQRQKIYEDIVVRLVTERSLQDVLDTNGFPGALSEQMATEIATLIEGAETLAAGSIVAIRVRPQGDQPVPLQVSVYGPQGYVGSVARRGTVGWAPSADPWIDEDLFSLSAPQQNIAAPQQDYRLLDAVYSAAIRQGVPTTLVGEMIVMLSQSYDLEAFAAPGDVVTILYTPTPAAGAEGPGQILFAGISGPSGEMPCYVAAASADKEFVCYSEDGQVGSGPGGAGFTTPVQGTLTSGFGPRHHPILKTVRLHGGVDWAAPTGTPIVSALDGVLAVVGDGGGYGNVIYVNHAGGLQSRYAHMSKFADGMRPGVQVRQGQVIGYVGTTGRSTGPHLHFEFRVNGEPVDPFTVNAPAPGAGGTVMASAGASGAVTALVDQIIRVESAGNANAKNPLSTATGLGQFIESTWLRMMRDYRPDLHSTMSRADLLDLRRDPTLSREMVTNLARENERFLSSRGHSITPGRLYLAHFLGPGGANTVLSSQDGATILAVMGSGVVNANPFLRNYTVADLKDWADRKMRGAGSGGGPSIPAAPARPQMTAEVRAYIDVVKAVLEEAG